MKIGENGRKEGRSDDKEKKKGGRTEERKDQHPGLDNETRTLILGRDERTVAYEVKIQPLPPPPLPLSYILPSFQSFTPFPIFENHLVSCVLPLFPSPLHCHLFAPCILLRATLRLGCVRQATSLAEAEQRSL